MDMVFFCPVIVLPPPPYFFNFIWGKSSFQEHIKALGVPTHIFPNPFGPIGDLESDIQEEGINGPPD